MEGQADSIAIIAKEDIFSHSAEMKCQSRLRVAHLKRGGGQIHLLENRNYVCPIFTQTAMPGRFTVSQKSRKSSYKILVDQKISQMF